MSDHQELDRFVQHAKGLKKETRQFAKDVSEYKKEEKTRTSGNGALASSKKVLIDNYLSSVKDAADRYNSYLSSYNAAFNEHELDAANYQEELSQITGVKKNPVMVKVNQKRDKFNADGEALIIVHRVLMFVHSELGFVVDQVNRVLPSNFANPVKHVDLARPRIPQKFPKLPNWGTRATKAITTAAATAALAKMMHSS